MPLWRTRLRIAPVAHDRGDRRYDHRNQAHHDGRRGRVEPHHEPRGDDERQARPHQDEVPLLAIHVSSVVCGGRRPGTADLSSLDLDRQQPGIRPVGAQLTPAVAPQHQAVPSTPTPRVWELDWDDPSFPGAPYTRHSMGSVSAAIRAGL